MPATHLIHRQTVEISLRGNTADARRVQEEVADLCRVQLADVLESLFDRLAPNDELIRIDRLTLDLGSLPEVSDSGFSQRFTQQLKEKLTLALTEAKLSAGPIRGTFAQDEEAIPEVRLKPSRDETEVLAFFLETGRLPWFATKAQASQRLSDWLPPLIKTQPEKTAQQLLRAVRIPAQSRRIALQLDEKNFTLAVRFLLKHALFYTNSSAGTKLLVFSALVRKVVREAVLPVSQPRTATTEQLRTSTLALLFSDDAGTSAENLPHHLTQILYRIFDLPSARRQFIQQQLSNEIVPHLRSSRTSSEKAYSKLKSVLQQASAKDEEVAAINIPEDSGSPFHQAGHRKVSDDTTDKASSAQKPLVPNRTIRKPNYRSVPAKPPPSVLIQNAGLVLLHPFLIHFFRNTGLLDHKTFVSVPAQERAVLLLQYLVTGQASAPEQELMLNKLMCGLPAELEVPFSIAPSALEKKEAATLLGSVISHWTVLKRTSPVTLRQTFLQREGLLRPGSQPDSWQLHIPRKSPDILLNRLPWGLSVIRLPWTTHLIYVEW